MQYILLIYDNEKNQLPPDERNKLFQEYGAFTQGIMKSGNFKAGDPLQPTSTATTVRVREGKTLKGKFLGLVLGTVGKGVVEKAFENSVKAMEEQKSGVRGAA